MNHFARAQFNYDNALPADDSARQEWIESRAEQLKKDMWQDLEYLTDAMGDVCVTIGWYRHKGFSNHPQSVTWLSLLRDGSDDIELARMLRKAATDYIAQRAFDMAEKEAS